MTNTEAAQEPVKENVPVQLTQDDFIEFGEMQFINGEMTALEMVLSLKRDQLQFQARQGLIKRYKHLQSTSRAMRAKFADLMTQSTSPKPQGDVMDKGTFKPIESAENTEQNITNPV